MLILNLLESCIYNAEQTKHYKIFQCKLAFVSHMLIFSNLTVIFALDLAIVTTARFKDIANEMKILSTQLLPPIIYFCWQFKRRVQ